MIFHVTITHTAEECPAGKRQALPELASASGERAPRLLLWDAGCVTGGAASHTAFAVIDAASAAAAEAAVGAMLPKGWQAVAAPVLLFPHQLEVAEQLAVGAPGKVEEAAASLAANGAPPKQEPAPKPEPAPQRPIASPDAVTMAVSQEGMARARAKIAELAASTPAPAARPAASAAAGPVPLGVQLVTADGLRSWPIGPDGATIGQARDNAVQIADDQIAPQHARVILWNSSYWVQDLGSSPAGVTVNGTRIQQSARLRPGDVIGVGRTNLVVRL